MVSVSPEAPDLRKQRRFAGEETDPCATVARTTQAGFAASADPLLSRSV